MKRIIKNKKKLITLVVIICAPLYFTINNLVRKDTNQIETFEKLSSNELITEFDNESFTNLIEKAIEIKGTLKDVQFKNNAYTLFISNKNSKTFVLCELQKDQVDKIPHLKIGQDILIKGILKGHLLDIILLNCIII